MPDSSNPPSLNAALAAIREQLACPACYGELRLDAGRLICGKCGRSYPVMNGIPVLTPTDK